MSSNARKQLPAEVLAHPAVLALIASGQPTGSITPDEVRQASEDADVEPRHLKALLSHLSGLGISVSIPAGTRAVAASTARKTATATAAKKAATKKTAAKAPAKKAAA
ncbi:MAG: RNA polymerase sigma factor region1.1 domain-containing protein, partial [Nocardioides sp.]